MKHCIVTATRPRSITLNAPPGADDQERDIRAGRDCGHQDWRLSGRGPAGRRSQKPYSKTLETA
jgi:hypothetical protein